MKRFILPLLIIFIFISLPAKANDEVKTLLKVLDKSLQNKASYTQQKQRHAGIPGYGETVNLPKPTYQRHRNLI